MCIAAGVPREHRSAISHDGRARDALSERAEGGGPPEAPVSGNELAPEARPQAALERPPARCALTPSCIASSPRFLTVYGSVISC